MEVIFKVEIFYIYLIPFQRSKSKLASMEKRLTSCLSQFSRSPPLDTTRTRTIRIFVFACLITIVCFLSTFARPIVFQLQLYIHIHIYIWCMVHFSILSRSRKRTVRFRMEKNCGKKNLFDVKTQQAGPTGFLKSLF